MKDKVQYFGKLLLQTSNYFNKENLIVDFTWNCNESINIWVFIFCIDMNIPAFSMVMGINVGLRLGHKMS